MKVVTTIHLDQTSTDADFERAVQNFAQATKSKVKNPQMKQLLIGTLKGMIHHISGPMEFRVTPNSEPVFVVHPKTRAIGAERKKEAVAIGDWMHTVVKRQ